MKNRLLRISIELFGWTFLTCLFLGIWMIDYRWRLLSTSLVSGLLAIILSNALTQRENKK